MNLSKAKKIDGNKIIICSIITSIIIIIDQFIKYLIKINKPDIGFGLIDIIFIKNHGSAFGLFQYKINIILIITFIFITIFIYNIENILKEKDYFAYFLILGGAISNLIDRIIYGYVIDYISILNFPVFNIADSAITIGAIIIIYQNIFKKK